jgi:hypothetical protein
MGEWYGESILEEEAGVELCYFYHFALRVEARHAVSLLLINSIIHCITSSTYIGDSI